MLLISKVPPYFEDLHRVLIAILNPTFKPTTVSNLKQIVSTMKIIVAIFVLFCFLGSSCEDDKNSPHIIIKTGKECGWCGGADSLVVTSIKSIYEFRSSCDETKNKQLEERTEREEWKDLISSLNWNEFKKINVNTCALCADGCDTWISIQNGLQTHEIRFTDNAPEIEPIKTFVEKLKVLHEEFRGK